jgi:excisionase family DNA binding protein
MHVRLASYTPQEIAQRLKVLRRTVYRWLEEGELHGVRFVREYRITEADLEG